MSNFGRRGRDTVGGSIDLSVEAMVRREMEKKRIREEILMAEFLRRQELEEEVIRELTLEGKIAMQQPEKFLLGSEIRGPVLNWQDVLGLDSRLGGAGARSSDGGIDGRLSLLNLIEGGMDKREFLLNRTEVGSFGGYPFQRQPEAATSGVVIKPVINLQKAEPVHLFKTMNSNTTTAGLKRKFETPTVADNEETSFVGDSKKKSQVNWSCDLCQVRATSEENLRAHFIGKKHKTREKALLNSTTAKSNNFSDSNPLPKETKEFTEVPPVLSTSNLDEARTSKFWCSVCNVGAISEVQINAHRMGSKHLKLIKERGGGVIAIKTMPDTICYDDINELSPEEIMSAGAQFGHVKPVP